ALAMFRATVTCRWLACWPMARAMRIISIFSNMRLLLIGDNPVLTAIRLETVCGLKKRKADMDQLTSIAARIADLRITRHFGRVHSMPAGLIRVEGLNSHASVGDRVLISLQKGQ